MHQKPLPSIAVFSALFGMTACAPEGSTTALPPTASRSASDSSPQLAPNGKLTKRPNVIIFITDDESWLERSIYGWSNLPTPNFDRVARDGVLFTRAYTPAPSCAPSRASLLTGRNFWELEQGAFIQAWLPSKFPRLPDLMKAEGYHTGYTGKGWGPGVYPPEGPRHNPAGIAYNDRRINKPEPGINGCDYAANFRDFLEARPDGETPFFFWAGCIEPHTPLGEENYRKLEERFGMGLKDIPMPGFIPDTEANRKTRGNILYEIWHADRDMGFILTELEERGELENTIVIVTADNGTQIPYSKATPYDWGVHVPLAIMWPAQVKANRRIDDFVGFHDLAPTILNAADINIPASMSGRSILATLRSESSGRVEPDRSRIVTGLEWHGELPPYSSAARSIRDERYQYIINYAKRPGNRTPPNRVPADYKEGETWEELYDCEKDPWELNNLATSPEHADIKARLKSELEAYQQKTKDPRVTGDMKLFEETRAMVEQRKREGYRDRKPPRQ